jgi:hypothetical protein
MGGMVEQSQSGQSDQSGQPDKTTDKPVQPKQTGPVAVGHPASTNISQIVYDRDSQTLTISFAKSGAVYEFYEVDESTVNGFSTSLSTTKYFNSYVENSFPSQRIA